MRKITLKYETTVEEDGRDNSVTFTEKGVETMEDWLLFLDEAVKGCGWSYLAYLIAVYDTGEEVCHPSNLL